MGDEWIQDQFGYTVRVKDSMELDKHLDIWRQYNTTKDLEKIAYWDKQDKKVKEPEVEQISTRAFNSMKRIAAAAMRELERNDLSDFVVLKDAELGKWWNAYKKQEAEEIEMVRIKEEKRIATKEARDARLAKVAEDARVKAELLSRLTPDEKRILGIK